MNESMACAVKLAKKKPRKSESGGVSIEAGYDLKTSPIENPVSPQSRGRWVNLQKQRDLAPARAS
jgi:hypothetical protein